MSSNIEQNGGSPRSISVVVADDHPLFREGLKQVIRADARFALQGEAANGAQALECIEALNPDVAVLDLNMPKLSGWEVAAAAQEKGLRARLVVLTMVNEEAAFNRAMNLGVAGYLLKESAVEEIITCLITVASGLPYVSPALSAFLLKRRRRADDLSQFKPTLESLTTAERRVLKRIADNLSSKEIAAQLRVSPKTVETHRANISAKLGLKGANSVLRFAIENRDALAQLD